VRSIRRLTVGLLLALAGLFLLAAPASAHTGFESSDPADGASLEAPVEVITLVFTGPAEPTGDGFQVLDPTGELRQPTDATTDDGSSWVLRFDPPVAGGVAGVRWMVKAPDAHPIDGSFSFTVSEAPPLAVEEDPTPQAASAAAPTDPNPVPSDADLEAFLDTEGGPTATARRVGAVGRVIMLAGTLLGLGALVFAAVVLRGDRRDVRHVLHWVRRAGVLVVVGALVEFAAQIAVEGGGTWSSLWSPSVIGAVVVSSFGLAVGLRIVGGLALASGARIDIAHAAGTADPVVAIKELVGVGAGSSGGSGTDGFHSHPDVGPTSGSEPYLHEGDHVWLPTLGSSGAVLGALALLAAFLFDGHTVTKGHRLVTGVVDVIHVAGGAVWVGGLLMLASVLWRRRRQHREVRALQLGVRFSVVATIALVAAGLAGLILTVIVLDSPSELWATEWGRLLVAKTLFVAIAAAAGGYNHKVLIPQLDRAPDDPVLADRFRSIVTGEAAALVAVVVLTALLMGAAS
jgi:copper transport protein